MRSAHHLPNRCEPNWPPHKIPGCPNYHCLTADDVMRVLGGLPLGKERCAHLAVNALQDSCCRNGARRFESAMALVMS